MRGLICVSVVRMSGYFHISGCWPVVSMCEEEYWFEDDLSARVDACDIVTDMHIADGSLYDIS